ncbi:hypothetical protein KAF25_001616 [Fusarium avenaceum]|uniref:Uncharacterized protein n=1 Tax=Fusarium avenaceum TaxID=40199 RepID=A0A9P7GTK0_9HYPO|nr:hypothetical protein KAF25_001616 [Fusarium avenaceum]
MKFTTALFAIASGVTFVSASPAPAAAPEAAALMSEESISKVPRSELLPRQACRGTNCSGCVNGRKCCDLRGYPFCCSC